VIEKRAFERGSTSKLPQLKAFYNWGKISLENLSIGDLS
jgi:hypothetical protein